MARLSSITRRRWLLSGLMVIFLCAAMGRSSVKLDHRVNQPLKVVKGPSIPFCGMSARNWEPVADEYPIALFIIIVYTIIIIIPQPNGYLGCDGGTIL